MKPFLYIISFLVFLNINSPKTGCSNKETDKTLSPSNSTIDNRSLNNNSYKTINVSDLQPEGNIITPEMFGAVGDGLIHKLSEKFSSLEDARKIYPNVVDLDITIDGAAFQKAVDQASLDKGEVLATKNYLINYPISIKDNVIIDGNNKGKLTNNRTRSNNTFNLAFLFGDHSVTAFKNNTNDGRYVMYDVNGGVAAGQNFLALTNEVDIKAFKLGQLIMVVSSYKRSQAGYENTVLPYHSTICKIIKIDNNKLFFEFPIDENITDVQIAANGTLDPKAGINYGGVQNVTLRNMTIDASQITQRSYAYNCHIDNIKLYNAIRLVGINAMSHCTYTNITGTFSWRCMEIKIGTSDVLIKNINATYKAIDGYPQPVDAISFGQYNRNVTVDSFNIDFNDADPKISTINFHSRKNTVSNGTITCKNLTSAFVTFYNEHYINDPKFGCYGNTLNNVKFYGGTGMKGVLAIGEGTGSKNKEPGKKSWAQEKKAATRKNNTDNDTNDDTDEIKAAPTADVAPNNNIIENCLFDGGSSNSLIFLRSGLNNTIRNCIFTHASLKVSPDFKSNNTISNNKLTN